MAHRVVCISLVTAAGGEVVGRLVAARLGFRYVDDEIITRAAEKAGVETKVVESAEHHQSFLARMMEELFSASRASESYFLQPATAYYAEDIKPRITPPADQLRQLIQDAIVETARRGDAVIVAHAASMALRGRADVLRVHVTASTETRVRRLFLGNMLITEKEYAAAIAESDQQRRKYLARFYGIDDESPTDYDLVLNTDVLDVAQAVAAVVATATAGPAA